MNAITRKRRAASYSEGGERRWERSSGACLSCLTDTYVAEYRRRTPEYGVWMRHAIYLPLFGALADPHAVTDIATAAEEAGWDGLFVWDHVLSPSAGEWGIADPWVMLGAAAAVTERIRVGTMVTPLPRRRVAKLARETVTLDRLSRGRLILGLGTGGDVGREYSAFGEGANSKRLGDILDEGAAMLPRCGQAALSCTAGSLLPMRSG